MAEVIPGIPTRHTFDRLGKAVKELKAKTVLELGTNIGLSTREFSTALRETGGKLYTVDINPPLGNWHTQFPCENIVFVQHDALTLNTTDLKDPVDILLIDDKHSYRHLLQELRKYGPLVRVGGRIFVDDPTHCDGVPSHEMNCGLPVLWATALWCREVGLDMTLHTEDSCGLLEIAVTKPIPLSPALDARIHGITGVATIIHSTHYHRDDA